MAHNFYKINVVEKMFWGGYRSIHTEKQFLDHINEIPPHGEETPSAMQYHFTHYLWETYKDKKYVKISIWRQI